MSYDKYLVIEILNQIIEAIEVVQKRCTFAKSEGDFCYTEEGQEKLDGICTKLVTVGESFKNIDKITDKKLLVQYPQVEWKKVS